jgi:hypothetical protein
MGATISSMCGGGSRTPPSPPILDERRRRYHAIAKHLRELNIGVFRSGLAMGPKFVINVGVYPSGEMRGCEDAHAFIVEMARQVDPLVRPEDIQVDVCVSAPVVTIS